MKESKLSENEEEEKAYEKIKEAFGIEPVKLIKQKKGMKFVQLNLDNNLQVAEMIYQCDGKNLLYIIDAGYYNSSFSFDADDKIIEKEVMEIGENDIELTVYQVKETQAIKCSAHFTYQKIEYFLVGKIDIDDFKLILKNLFFS